MWEWGKQDSVASWDTGKKREFLPSASLVFFFGTLISKSKIRKCGNVQEKGAIKGRRRAWELESVGYPANLLDRDPCRHLSRNSEILMRPCRAEGRKAWHYFRGR